jgi:hypothetical protein
VRRRRVEERGWAGDARVVDVKARACHGQKEEEDSREREERNGRCVVGVALLIDAALFERAARPFGARKRLLARQGTRQSSSTHEASKAIPR